MSSSACSAVHSADSDLSRYKRPALTLALAHSRALSHGIDTALMYASPSPQLIKKESSFDLSGAGGGG